MNKLLLITFLSLFINACSVSEYIPKISDLSLPNILSFKPYKADVHQGSVLSRFDINRLKIGMSKAQVQNIMGQPSILDPFHNNQWDYAHYTTLGSDEIVNYRLILTFVDGKLFGINDDDIKSLPPMTEKEVARQEARLAKEKAQAMEEQRVAKAKIAAAKAKALEEQRIAKAKIAAAKVLEEQRVAKAKIAAAKAKVLEEQRIAKAKIAAAKAKVLEKQRIAKAEIAAAKAKAEIAAKAKALAEAKSKMLEKQRIKAKEKAKQLEEANKPWYKFW